MKVFAKDEAMAKLIKHPNGTGFINGEADWPEDQFTTRRLRDGDVLTEAPKSKHAAPAHAAAKEPAAKDSSKT